MSSFAPRADLELLRAEYQRHRRVLVPQLLAAPLLQALHARILDWPEWALVTRLSGEHRTFDSQAMDRVDAATRAAFEAHVAAEAQRGFQYLFERYALVDRGDAGQLADPVLSEVYRALCSEDLLSLVRQISGETDIARIDGQLTRYRRGHFLSAHDDAAPTRRVAYSLNLSANWPAAQGGGLQFLDAHGEALCSWAPQMNALSLFAVPQPHRVEAVSADAIGSRFAITGWFHSH
jgi:SM-20-related protein